MEGFLVEENTDVVKYRRSETLNGVHIPTVLYAAVREYHDCIAQGDMEALFNFEVSVETARKVGEDIRDLAASLNGGVIPAVGKNSSELSDMWKLLPADVYDLLTWTEIELIANTAPLPLEGSAKRRDVMVAYSGLAKKLTVFIVNAYNLPNSIEQKDKVNLQRALQLSGLPKREAATTAKKMSRAVYFILPTGSVSVFSSLVALGATTNTIGLTIPAYLVGGIVTVFSFVASSDLIPPFSHKKIKARGVFGWGRKHFKRNFVEYDQVVQPYLASMEKFLVQENKNVDILINEKTPQLVLESKVPANG